MPITKSCVYPPNKLQIISVLRWVDPKHNMFATEIWHNDLIETNVGWFRA
jgi:hypothetical protein